MSPRREPGADAVVRNALLSSYGTRMYQYQDTERYFAQVAGGLEALGAEELEALGATDVASVYRGVHFNAAPAVLYRVNYEARLPTRVLAPLISFGCHSPDYLYRTAQTLDWTDFLTAGQTFAVFANVSNSKIRHSKYAALRVKDAIVDQFREQTGRRPSVDTRDPDVWVNLYIENNRATLSLGTSGGSMHRRGYRTQAGSAPMQETVAAAVIRMSGWTGERPLYDPMCGSGTLLAEALMQACHIPAGYLRTGFGFERLPDFEAAVWHAIKAEADARIRPLPEGLIAGSDRDPAMVKVARANLRHLPSGDRVEVQVAEYQSLYGFADTTLVLNPPYGVRMKNKREMADFMKELGDFLKQRCTGSTAFIYAGDRTLLKRVGLRPAWKKPLVNGALDGRLARYDLY